MDADLSKALDEPDRTGAEFTPRIGVWITVQSHEPGKQNDDLTGWLESFLNGRKEVKAVKIQVADLSPEIAEVSDGEQREHPGTPGQADSNDCP